MMPDFNSDGDLPPGVYQVTLEEAIFRFGDGHPQRQEMTRRLSRIYGLAQEIGAVQHFLLFGSYVTKTAAPNDIDIVLIIQINSTFQVARNPANCDSICPGSLSNG